MRMAVFSNIIMSEVGNTLNGTLTTVYFRVKGHVQGVFFRVETKSVGEQLGITGWVKNRSDGDVEGMATGEHTNLSKFTDWLKKGPELANVASVKIKYTKQEVFKKFEIRGPVEW